VDDIFDRTLAVLRANRALLEESAARLLEIETLDEDDITAIRAKVVAPKAEAA
jgi:cell division protease FtsH